MVAISVAGFASCPFHQQALAAAQKLVAQGKYAEVDDLTKATRDEYQSWLKSSKPSFEDERAATHTSSPFVFSGSTFIGGCDDTLALLAASSHTSASSSTSRRLRAVGDHLGSGAATTHAVAADAGPAMNEQVIVESLPTGALQVDNFRLQRVPAPSAESLADGEVLCETIAFVIAAGQRAGLQGSASYAGAPVTDVVMGGGSISRVVASNDSSVGVGAMVSSNGWERFTVQKAKGLTVYEEGDDGLDPVHHIGVLGGNGLTAYFGLLDVGKPQAGETVLVSGAAGSVGHLVCQLAKNAGCHVVGIAGSDDKCNLLRSDLGVDETVNCEQVHPRPKHCRLVLLLTGVLAW